MFKNRPASTPISISTNHFPISPITRCRSIPSVTSTARGNYAQDANLLENSVELPPYSSTPAAPVPLSVPILPRDEEGLETLPGYSPTIHKHGPMRRKPELASPYLSSAQRSWQFVYIELNNTQLNVYRLLRIPGSNLGSNSTSNKQSKQTKQPDSTELNNIDLNRTNKRKRYLTGTVVENGTCKIGKLLKSYSLQYADVGVAVDYLKRPNVLRIRAEGEQFLLQTVSEEAHISWINSIQMGIDLALPLDEREFPKVRMIPRRAQRRNQASNQPPPPPPPPVHEPASPGFNSTVDSAGLPEHRGLHRIVQMLKSKMPAGLVVVESRIVSSNGEQQQQQQRQQQQHEEEEYEDRSSFDQSQSSSSDEYSSDFDESLSYSNILLEKWEPEHPILSKRALLKYAHSCLIPLPASSPWLNKMVYIKGHKYVVKYDAFVRVKDGQKIR